MAHAKVLAANESGRPGLLYSGKAFATRQLNYELEKIKICVEPDQPFF